MSKLSKLTTVICIFFLFGCIKREPVVQPNGSKAAPEAKAVPDPLPEFNMLNLDKDNNGLYDDTERKALLDAFMAACPKLKGPFDTNGDGKVTVLEQTTGRHPLSFLTKEVLKSDKNIPWAVDIFPEWVMTAYFQENVALGTVGEHTPRGTIKVGATQENAGLRPKKTTARGGVEFAANSGQHLTMRGQRDARWNYRWSIFTFRIDAKTGTGDETVLLDINQGRGSSKSTPKIWYSKSDGLMIQYVGQNKGGLDRRVMTSTDVVADGKTWNVIVCGVRQGRMFASVNGRALSTKQPDRFGGHMAYNVTSYLGDKRKSNMAWAYDALVMGIAEPSEAMVRKMTGWAAHRLGFQANLPVGHPYKVNRPVLDKEDFPYRYIHDNEKWTKWGQSLKPKARTRVNAGGPRKSPEGFERVFYDDFRAYRVSSSLSGEGDLWMAPGFNTAVGASVQLQHPGRKPNVYAYDAAKKKQILSLAKAGEHWRGSAFYSVNDMGHGYTWKGPKVFRIRCMFPKVAQEDLGHGLFPAFWSYDPDFIFWRTANRIEVDWFEFDGKNGRWYNGISTHYHYAHVKNIFAKNPKSYKRYKVYSGELTEKKSKIPGGLFFWDGDYHTWEFVVDQDMTYVNVTIKDKSGKDRWVEVCRCQTAPTYLERLNLQLDYALKKGYPKTSERQDFVVDWVEVLQKTSQLQAAPEPFAGTPQLTGSVTAGSTVTCQVKLPGITDIRYYWFADGYPLTYGSSSAYKITSAEAGKKIRCMVKAVGACSQPEAWSNVLK